MEDAARAEQARRAQQAAQRAAQQAAANRAALARTFGPFNPAELSKVSANPYAWQGKQVGLCGSFQGMLGPSTASFSFDLEQAIVEGVPSTRFRERGEYVYMVAKVRGLSQGITQLQYVGVVPSGPHCSGYAP